MKASLKTGLKTAAAYALSATIWTLGYFAMIKGVDWSGNLFMTWVWFGAIMSIITGALFMVGYAIDGEKMAEGLRKVYEKNPEKLDRVGKWYTYLWSRAWYASLIGFAMFYGWFATMIGLIISCAILECVKYVIRTEVKQAKETATA